MENLVGTDEVCRFLNVKKPWLYVQVRQGKIPHYHVGNLLRFCMAEVKEYLQKNRRKVQD